MITYNKEANQFIVSGIDLDGQTVAIILGTLATSSIDHFAVDIDHDRGTMVISSSGLTNDLYDIVSTMANKICPRSLSSLERALQDIDISLFSTPIIDRIGDGKIVTVRDNDTAKEVIQKIINDRGCSTIPSHITYINQPLRSKDDLTIHDMIILFGPNASIDVEEDLEVSDCIFLNLPDVLSVGSDITISNSIIPHKEKKCGGLINKKAMTIEDERIPFISDEDYYAYAANSEFWDFD